MILFGRFLSGFLVMISVGHLYAQQGIATSGGDAMGSGGSASYSVGQPDFLYFTGTGGTVQEGLQHAYEISVVTSAERALDIGVSVYPNPAKDQIVLTVPKAEAQHFRFVFYDAPGKNITEQQVSKDETPINLEQLPNGVYYLRVVNGRKQEKVFKIIKTP